ncbi:MAG TPA: hypothetical protein VF092_20390 [Longimicrobium sp.]
MYTLRFDENDLAHDRRGYLSEPQRQLAEHNAATMRTQGLQALRWFGAWFALILVAGAVVELGRAGWDPARLTPSGGQGLGIAAALLVVMFAIAAGSALWSTRRYHRGAIRSVEGVARVVDKQVWHGGPHPVRNLELRRGLFRKFTFRFQDAESLGYFRGGARYRVYYLPAAIPIALSAEKLDG